MKISRALVGLCLGITPLSFAQTISLAEVLASVERHHPLIAAAEAKRQQSDFKRLRAEGAFDLQLAQKSKVRTSGFYNGLYADQSITKPLKALGANVTARYRVSGGTFPIYEDIVITESGGEASIGVAFSLLQNRDIDARRLGLLNADSEIDAAQFTQRLTENRLLYDASNAYLDWYLADLQVDILQELVDLAEDRRTAIETRVAGGDLAAITQTEFETTLLGRQAALLEAKQTLLQQAQRLGFYWRDGKGEQQSAIGYTAEPLNKRFDMLAELFAADWHERVMAQHPQLLRLNAELQLARNAKRGAQNRFLPQLDVEVKVAEDFGEGSITLEGTESYVGLNFSVPLERRQARADEAIADARERELLAERRALEEQLTLDLRIARQQLGALEQLFAVKQQQAQVAKQLERQEHARFEAGDSDQFLLNARETQSGQAQLEMVEARIAVVAQQLDLLALSVDLHRLAKSS